MAIQGVGMIKAILDLNSTPFQKALNEAAMKTRSFQKSINEAAMKTRSFQKGTMQASGGGLKQMSGAIAGMTGKLGVWGAALFGAYRSLKGIGELGNSYIKAQRILKYLTKDTKDYGAVSQKVNELSNKYGSDIEDTAQGVQRLLIATRGLGVSNKEGVAIYEAMLIKQEQLNESSENLSGFMRQITQAAAEGRVSMENLNSAQDNSIGLMEALADSMGFTLTELRKMARDGKVSGVMITEGLKKMGMEVDTNYKRVRTVEAAWQTLSNVVSKALGEMFQSSGGLTALAGMIDAISTGISEYLPVVLKEITGFIKGIIEDLGGMGTITKYLKFLWDSFVFSIKAIWTALKGTIKLIVNIGVLLGKLITVTGEWLGSFDTKKTEKETIGSFERIRRQIVTGFSLIPGTLAAMFTGDFWVTLGKVIVNEFSQIWKSIVKLFYEGMGYLDKGLSLIGLGGLIDEKAINNKIQGVNQELTKLGTEHKGLMKNLFGQIGGVVEEEAKKVEESAGKISDAKKKIAKAPPPIKWVKEVTDIMKKAKESTEDYAKQYVDLLNRNDPAKQHQSRLTEINNEYNEMIKKVNEYYKDNMGLEGKLAKSKVLNALATERAEKEKVERLKEQIRLTDAIKESNKKLNEIKREAILIYQNLSEAVKRFGMLEFEKQLLDSEKQRLSTIKKINKLFKNFKNEQGLITKLAVFLGKLYNKNIDDVKQEIIDRKTSKKIAEADLKKLADKLANLEKSKILQSTINELKMQGLGTAESEAIQAAKTLDLQLRTIKALKLRSDKLSELGTITEEQNQKNQMELDKSEDNLLNKADERDEKKNKKNKEELTQEQKHTSILNAFKLKTDKQVHAQREQLQAQHFDTIMEAMKKHSKTSFAIFKALRLAQATISGLQAIVEAFRFGTQLGGVGLGATFAATATAATALQISQIASMKFEGKRFGGAVKGGNFYEVAEQKNPEFLSIGNRNILGMPKGMSGHVTPLNTLNKINFGGSSKGVIINIINESENVNIEEESRQETPEGEQITFRIQDVVANSIIEGNNPIASALQSTYPLRRQGGF